MTVVGSVRLRMTEGSKLLSQHADLLSGPHGGPQWGIGSCGRADAGVNPTLRCSESESLNLKS